MAELTAVLFETRTRAGWWTRLRQELGRRWCKLAHRKARWPIRGKYECPRCLRQHQTPF